MGLGSFVCQFSAQGGEVSSLIQTNYEHIAFHPNNRQCLRKGHIRSLPPQRGGVAVRHWYVSPHLDKYTISYILPTHRTESNIMHTWRQRVLQYMSDVHIALQAQRHQLINSNCHPNRSSIKYKKKDYNKIPRRTNQNSQRKREKETTVRSSRKRKKKKKKECGVEGGEDIIAKNSGLFFCGLLL